MNTRSPFVSVLLLIGIILSACGPSQADLDARATQVAANIFATQTAQAPTATPTFTPSPTPTATATATPTPTPTNTPTPTPTPTPGLSSVALTLNDLPAGFEAKPAEELLNAQRSFPEGSSAFSFSDDKRAQFVMGALIPYPTRDQQASFDKLLPQFVGIVATGVGAGANPKQLRGLDDIGQARAGITTVGKVESLSLQWDIMGFRRGQVGVLFMVAYPVSDKPAVPIADLARLLDERISGVHSQPLPTATASPTPKPTLPPASPAPKPPTAVAPTQPAAAPGVDVVAERGKETCINKYVSVSYPWEAEQEPQGRKMFYWDEKWSVYPMFARPNIKFQTVLADCNKDKQCKGFTADFCVYIDGSAPPGGSYETEVSLIIASAYPPDQPNGPIRGPKLLATTVAKFSWLIR